MVDNYFHDEVIAQQLAIFRETLGFGATKYCSALYMLRNTDLGKAKTFCFSKEV